MPGRSARDKGNRVERELVNAFKAAGMTAERVPLSGAAGGSYTGDLIVEGMRAEVKVRKGGAGFTQLEKWMGDNDLLILKRDRQPPMVAMDWETFVTLQVSEKRVMGLVGLLMQFQARWDCSATRDFGQRCNGLLTKLKQLIPDWHYRLEVMQRNPALFNPREDNGQQS